MRASVRLGVLVIALAAISAGSFPASGQPIRGGEVAGSHASRGFWQRTYRLGSAFARLSFTGAVSPIAALARGAGGSVPLFRFPVSGKIRDDRPVVAREQGRQVLSFPVREPAPELFVNVTGQVEFERADIGFADGTVESVDAYGVARDTGLYELASYGRARPVEWVRLVLRARSRRARVGVCIGA